MPYFALMYETADDYVERRGQFRPQHLELARDAYARGELILAEPSRIRSTARC